MKTQYYELFIVLCISIGLGGGIQFALAGMPIVTASIVVMCVFFIRLTRNKIKTMKNNT